jgi:mono/diheme cytochrome c family protein
MPLRPEVNWGYICTLGLWLAWGGLTTGGLNAQSPGAALLTSGKDIYRAGCAGCHGELGKGAPQSTIGFKKPDTFPDFTQCDQTTPEDHWEWKSVIRDGGPSRGFSPIMPSFSGALSSAQIDAVMEYMRGFCKEKGWPRGELNLPLALGTEKAYPEDEEVMIGSVNAQGAPGFSSEFIHEQRFGKKNQIEIQVPINYVHAKPGLWYAGLGDIGVGAKRVMFSSLKTGSILSLGGDVIAPTGNSLRGLGSGVTTFENYAAFDQLMPRKFYFQFQGGADLPTHPDQTPQSVFINMAAGKWFNQNHGLGRLWAPMVELLGSRDLEDGASTNWDVMPELSVTLSRRQHVRFDVGVRIPATNTRGRDMQVMFYFLWDWLDGKLTEGW